MKLKYIDVGDSALQVVFGNAIDLETNMQVYALAQLLLQSKLEGIVEMVPAYCTLTIYYDPCILGRAALAAAIDKLQEQAGTAAAPAQVLEIPVLYGGAMGPDLDFIAQHAGLSPEEVIARHSAAYYRIYMLGFLPGFTYLGGLDPQLSTPRLQEPRLKIEPGSVGIAGSQTGIYPLESPGGWQLLGRTPVKLYDPYRQQPFLPQAGQYIKFKSISQAEYTAIEQQVQAGTYVCTTYPLPGGAA